MLVARDLAPADTALLDLDQVLALITTDGGPTSHTAILAREKGIVAVVGVGDGHALTTGETVIVDAAAGVITREPTDDERARAAERAAARRAQDDADRERTRSVTLATLAGVGLGALAIGAVLLLSRDSEAPKAKAKAKRKKTTKKA